MSKHQDTVHLLRAVVKCSTALTFLDEVVDQKKYHKYGFKQWSDRWAKSIEMHTAELMNVLVQENSELLMQIYEIIETSLDKVQVGSPERTSLFCYYVMIKSAVNDITRMKDRSMVYAKVIELATNKVLIQIEKQYKLIIETKDSDGNDFTYLVDYLDDLGEKVMINKNEEEKEGAVRDDK